MKEFREWVALALSVIALLLTLYFQYWQDADLQLGIGRDVFLNAKPRIGFLVNVYNRGARPGSVVVGKLGWDGQLLPSTMISPQVETWTFTTEGMRKPVADTTYSYMPPTVIGSRASQALMVWFGADVGTRLFTAGDHTVELSLYDGVKSGPVACSRVTVHLEYKNVSDIYDPKNAGVEITVNSSSPGKCQ